MCVFPSGRERDTEGAAVDDGFCSVCSTCRLYTYSVHVHIHVYVVCTLLSKYKCILGLVYRLMMVCGLCVYTSTHEDCSYVFLC